MKRPWDAIVWWELRRIPYNVLLAAVGLITILVVFEIAHHLGWADAVPLNPLGLLLGVLAYGIAANVFYTLGWVTELLWSWGDTSRTEATRRTVFWIGVIFAAGVTLSPVILIPAAWALSAVLGFRH